jgi:polyribonucleotide nucleotidyltransferase
MKKEAIEKARKMIEDIARVAQIGEIFEGTVTRVDSYGAFVNLFGQVDGLCHVSELGHGYIKEASDVTRVGETLKVKVIGIDNQAKVK